MPKINILDSQTANLIAAGEVVERPANAVKEMLENSIDAGATKITIEISDGGTGLIRITDNGCGIAREDLPRAILRHATSKISSPTDLDAINTLGFRGEALAAISSTSRFTIMSKRVEDKFGSQINVEGDSISEPEECGCPDGTSIIVRDLFFNQPARKKFLKRPMTEGAAVYQYVQRIAVSRPEISFTYISDSEKKLFTPGNGKEDECIFSVFGKEFSSSLVPFDEDNGVVRVHGFITRPEYSRNNHSLQLFYINRRFVRSKTMQFALEDAYRSFVKSEKFPGCVIFLDTDTGKVDVNVHPSKLEVRFEDEKAVYSALYGAVRNKLENLSNQIARDEFLRAREESGISSPAAVRNISEKEPYFPPQKVFTGTYTEKAPSVLPLFAAAQPSKPHFSSEKEETPIPAEVEIKTFVPETSGEQLKMEITAVSGVPEKARETGDGFNPLRKDGVIRGVIFNAYIIYEEEDAVYFIDKHAAHERILYEKIKEKRSSPDSQLLISPVVISFSPMQTQAISAETKALSESGFVIEPFGENRFILRGIPPVFDKMSGDDLKELLRDTADEIMLGGRAAGQKEKAFDKVLYNMACKAAVKAGIPTTKSDDEWIVEKLRETDNIIVCPHGRPIISKFTKKQIADLFLRD